MKRRLLTLTLILAFGLGIWALAVVDFMDVSSSFSGGETVSASTFNDLFSAVNSNFDTAKEAIEQNQSAVTALQTFTDNLVEGPCATGSAIRAVSANGSVTCQSVGSAATPYTAGAGLTLTDSEFSLDTGFTDARYLMTEGGGVIDGDVTINAPTFVGVNRSNRISSFEAFGVRTDYGDNAWGGMYIETVSPTGRPFYGYSVGGGQNAWTEFHGNSGEWRLFNTNGFKVVVQSNGDTTISGNLTLSGSLTENSDRHVKHDLQMIDTADILTRVSTLPISTWRYDHSPEVTHIGPMAQDFYEIFGFGHGETTISTTDRDGVALAAIQALYELVQEQQSQIATLEARLAAIELTLLQTEH